MAQGPIAELLASWMHAAGVRHVFGYPGESLIDFMEAGSDLRGPLKYVGESVYRHRRPA
jgi:thiamine pyrophosphate-dependent acetolactate synthase large subunit-like protein